MLKIGAPYKWVGNTYGIISSGLYEKHIQPNEVFLLIDYESKLKKINVYSFNEYNLKIMFQNEIYYVIFLTNNINEVIEEIIC